MDHSPATGRFPIRPDEAVSNVTRDILLTLLTCGIYNLVWQARQFRVINAFLGREEFRFWNWLLLVLVTCGLYHVYNQYIFAKAINRVQRQLGKPVAENLPMISLLVSILGLTVIADAIQQSEINGFFE